MPSVISYLSSLLFRFRFNMKIVVLIGLSSLTLSACDSIRDFGSNLNPNTKTATAKDTAETIFGKAQKAERDGNMITASELYVEIDRRFPYSPLATKAQLRAAYALYKAEKYEDSIASVDRFIQLHPGSDLVPYAYYLRAMNSYDQITDVGRDQGHTLRAREGFEELIRRFPQSAYAKDASGKIDLTIDQLAGKEMEVGRYYQRDNHYLAAIERYRTVVEDFERTNHVREALHRLTECYLALGIQQEAQSAAAVLGHNYPKSKWYRESFRLLKNQNLQPKAVQGSWLSRRLQR